MPDDALNHRDPRHTDGSVSVVEHVDAGFITLAQAARYLGAVSTATVRRWIKGHGLPHYHITGCGGERGKLLFRPGELDRWMRRFRNGLAASKNEDGLGEKPSATNSAPRALT